MNNMLQMMMQQMMKGTTQKMTNQLEQQLKRINPQAFQEYQRAKQDNVNPNEYLNKITGGFNDQQKEQWNAMINDINVK